MGIHEPFIVLWAPHHDKAGLLQILEEFFA